MVSPSIPDRDICHAKPKTGFALGVVSRRVAIRVYFDNDDYDSSLICMIVIVS